MAPKKPAAAGWYSYLPSEPPTFAPFTAFIPGEHEQAFTADECDRILELASGPGEKGTVQDTDSVKTAVRDVSVVHVPVTADTAWLFDRIHQAVDGANAAWWRFELTHLAGVEVLRYAAGQHYVAHTDWGPGFATRKLSVSVQLSEADAYTGGDLELRLGDKPVKVRRERGTIVVFPSWTLHRVTPVKSGERRAMTAWVQGPAFR